MSDRKANRGQSIRRLKRWFRNNKASGTAFIMAGTLVLALVALVLGYGLQPNGWKNMADWLTGKSGGWCWILYIAIVIVAILVVTAVHYDKINNGRKRP